MNEKEMRELGAWIAEHVMGEKMHPSRDGFAVSPDFTTDKDGFCLTGVCYPVDSYTTDPAAAFEVLKKCAENSACEVYFGTDGFWHIDSDSTYYDSVCRAKGETLEIAICQFAKQLFSK